MCYFRINQIKQQIDSGKTSVLPEKTRIITKKFLSSKKMYPFALLLFYVPLFLSIWPRQIKQPCRSPIGISSQPRHRF